MLLKDYFQQIGDFMQTTFHELELDLHIDQTVTCYFGHHLSSRIALYSGRIVDDHSLKLPTFYGEGYCFKDIPKYFYANEARQHRYNDHTNHKGLLSSFKPHFASFPLKYFKHHFVIYRMTSTAIDIVRILGENMEVKRHL